MSGVVVDHYEIRIEDDDPEGCWEWNASFDADDFEGLANVLWLVRKLADDSEYYVMAWERHPLRREPTERTLTEAESDYLGELLTERTVAA